MTLSRITQQVRTSRSNISSKSLDVESSATCPERRRFLNSLKSGF
jgi:hypothetical protein